MLRKMGWGGAGLGAKEQGIEQPISGGEVIDFQLYKYKLCPIQNNIYCFIQQIFGFSPKIQSTQELLFYIKYISIVPLFYYLQLTRQLFIQTVVNFLEIKSQIVTGRKCKTCQT